MARKKVTVTLDADQVAKIKRLVERGEAASVSGFVQHAVEVGLQDVAGWGAMLASALAQSGGPLTGAERAWADGVLGARGGSSSKRRRQRRAA